MKSGISNKLEVLSIHIPKTAGTSFYRALQSVYGESAVLRLNFQVGQENGLPVLIATHNTDQSELDRIVARRDLGDDIRVLHGHFRYDHFMFFFELLPETKVISWLRDPIQRTLSSYNYNLESLGRDGENATTAKRLRENPAMNSFLEFAHEPFNVRVFQNFLGGREMSDYDFLGIVELYEEELQRLSSVLGTAAIPNLRLNATGGSRYTPSREELDALIPLYEKAQIFYQESLALREARLQ